MFSTFLTAAAFASGEPPVAEAGLSLIAYVGDTVILDGSGSSDREGDTLSWQWTQLSGPPITIGRDDSAEPEFAISDAGTFRIELVVNDGTESSAPDIVEVVVPYQSVEVASGCSSGGTGVVAGWGSLLGALVLVRVRRR